MYVPATGWRKLATVGMTSGPDQPYLMTYQIGNGLLVLTTSALGYSGGFEMFGSSNPLNTVKLVENLRAYQDSLYNYSLSTITAPADAVLTIEGPDQGIQQQSFKVTSVENTRIHVVVEAAGPEHGRVSITNVSGLTLADLPVYLQRGKNEIKVPVHIINGNIYIATLTRQGKTIGVKFLKK